MQNFATHWKPALAVTMLVLLALSSASAMLGDLTALQASRLESRWMKSGVVTEPQWSAAESYLTRALGYSPAHPEYLLGLGRLGGWQLDIEDGHDPELSARRLQQSLGYFRDQVQLRPYWPYGWEGLALLKAQAGEFDEEFEHAFRTARKMGPSEMVILKRLLETSLRHWSQLSWPMREQAMGLLTEGLQLSRIDRSVLDIAKQNGMLVPACFIAKELVVSERIRKRCRI